MRASILFLLALTACTHAETPRAGAPMTREGANALIRGYAEAKGGSAEGLNAEGLEALTTGSVDLAFQLEGSSLKASALIYRFRKDPKPGLIEAMEDEAHRTPTGGGAVDYEPESKAVFLSRTYTAIPSEAQFTADLDALAAAAKQWSTETVQAVAERVWHPADAGEAAFKPTAPGQ